MLPGRGYDRLNYVGDDPVADRAVFGDGEPRRGLSAHRNLYLYDGTTVSPAPADADGPYVRWREDDPLTGQPLLQDRNNALFRYDGESLMRLGDETTFFSHNDRFYYRPRSTAGFCGTGRTGCSTPRTARSGRSTCRIR